jgi:hypothetical protein
MHTIGSGLSFVPASFTLQHRLEGNAMDAARERDIIRLWNRLRLLEREGRSTEALRRQIQQALAEREQHAA